MYTMQQAERLATDFLQQNADVEAALIDKDGHKGEKGEFF